MMACSYWQSLNTPQGFLVALKEALRGIAK
jgi:hypothetical protein